MDNNNPLVAEFDTEMMRTYQRALSEANYKATRFLHISCTRIFCKVALSRLRQML
jgi:hypothetical protein